MSKKTPKKKHRLAKANRQKKRRVPSHIVAKTRGKVRVNTKGGRDWRTQKLGAQRWDDE